jgi:D-sedoheptulose 7-phosphate isomerase
MPGMNRSTDQLNTELDSITSKVMEMAEETERARRLFFDRSADAVARASLLIADAMRNGGKLLVFGNGGSAADAQHIAAELAFRMGRERRALPALALTTDTSLLTAVSNDHSFDLVFARQLQALGRKGDVALGISTSGNSANVIEAFKEAKELGITTVALLGNDGGKAANLVDVALIVPHQDTPRIQEVHITIGHIICQLIEDELCP